MGSPSGDREGVSVRVHRSVRSEATTGEGTGGWATAAVLLKVFLKPSCQVEQGGGVLWVLCGECCLYPACCALTVGGYVMRPRPDRVREAVGLCQPSDHVPATGKACEGTTVTLEEVFGRRSTKSPTAPPPGGQSAELLPGLWCCLVHHTNQIPGRARW